MLQTHRGVHPVNGKGRKDIKARKAGVAHLLSGVKEFARGIEFRGNAVDRVIEDFQRVGRHLMFSPGRGGVGRPPAEPPSLRTCKSSAGSG